MVNRSHVSSTGKPRNRWLSVGLACVLSLGISAVVSARAISGDAYMGEQSEYRIVQRGAVSLQEAVTMATRQVPGRVARAETVTRNGRAVHEVVIIQEDGLVRTVRIDAESGSSR
jgi:uncharacterized membrane protein YkoI